MILCQKPNKGQNIRNNRKNFNPRPCQSWDFVDKTLWKHHVFTSLELTLYNLKWLSVGYFLMTSENSINRFKVIPKPWYVIKWTKTQNTVAIATLRAVYKHAIVTSKYVLGSFGNQEWNLKQRVKEWNFKQNCGGLRGLLKVVRVNVSKYNRGLL